MQNSGILDETSSLAGSAYELISSTDGESQDGGEPDSLAASITSSFNVYPRADDVHSLNGNEIASDEEDEDEEAEEEEEDEDEDDGHLDQSSGYLPTQTRNTPGQSQLYHAGEEGRHGSRQPSPADSIRYAEQALCNPSTQSLSTLEYDSSHGDISGGRSPLVQSIEFNEDTGVKPYLEKVSVKHTIREFSEGESTIIAANMGMAADAPNRMAATICQTMSRQCLSTREPLRVLYVGSDAAKNDIMYKISSAITASGTAPNNASSETERRHGSTPGIYNIMRISSFGSAKVPEIDEIQLMGVSEYYIEVERCVKAEETVYKGDAFPNDTVYSIELESGKSHVSVFSPSGSTVSPQWTLPHVAVFYVSENDDKQTEMTRDAAWEFMTRHAVPYIFISHSQSFSRSASAGRWQNFVDQSAVHLCLESRDPSKPIAPERLPIDLTSFLNIDARQMNRNLAYITGHKDVPKGQKKGSKTAGSSEGGDPLVTAAKSVRLFFKGEDWRPEARQAFRELGTTIVAYIWDIVFSIIIGSMIGAVLVLNCPIMPKLQKLVAFDQISVPSILSARTTTAVVNHAPSSRTASGVPRITFSAPPLVPVMTLSYTTTKTADVSGFSQTSTAGEIQFGGYLTENAHNHKTASDTKIKTTGCTIQMYSGHEILVKVPAATKTKWLAEGAIDIDVWRGHKLLKSRLSTTDQGIIIELDRKDAVGVMTVSIVTTRRPKINETFAVDFGQPSATRLLEAGLNLWKESMRTAADAGLEAASQARKALADYADEHNLSRFYPNPAQEAVDRATRFVNRTASGLTAMKKELASSYEYLRTSPSANQAVQDTKSFLGQFVPSCHTQQNVWDEIHLRLIRAQVASKLWWLRAQGKMNEHDVYQKRATYHIGNLDAILKESWANKDASCAPVAPEAAAPRRQPAGWFW
ncbi:hypothetical protein SEUCBS139899_007686 [Sporothrix eucalyptigena]|uniref:Uncharacterized protein n=1 Tax=Sporothrix eucalyptigena TaxID=1812306 RepID=A0ABP0CFU7_9PEZI